MQGLFIRVTILLGAVLWPLYGFTGTEDELREASAIHLQGLPGVRVEVVFKGDESNLTVNEEKIQTDVELRLRLAGISVLTEKEWRKITGLPSLRIYVSAVRRNEVPNIYAYHILVLFSELVRPERRMGNDPVFAATWAVPIKTAGLTGAATVSKIRSQILDEVDQFINAFLAVNPLTPPSGKRN